MQTRQFHKMLYVCGPQYITIGESCLSLVKLLCASCVFVVTCMPIRSVYMFNFAKCSQKIRIKVLVKYIKIITDELYFGIT